MENFHKTKIYKQNIHKINRVRILKSLEFWCAIFVEESLD